ncbi:hypothetical protein AT246_05360 [Bartonella henselae]|nr:hypothetical protein AT237_02165 [Bartonella henselae]OLL41932.1 hypothetical protein AT244_03910 [Bartonella henselae]OLL45528.1 hypothetical protein AT242_00145 [Bartonella henselae]OLL49036.1 hypothetical protein AT241_01920 [Bartonella henselae]OLL50802.1 hypothetical protein AT247_05400 [Bartonella henselae]
MFIFPFFKGCRVIIGTFFLFIKGIMIVFSLKAFTFMTMEMKYKVFGVARACCTKLLSDGCKDFHL